MPDTTALVDNMRIDEVGPGCRPSRRRRVRGSSPDFPHHRKTVTRAGDDFSVTMAALVIATLFTLERLADTFSFRFPRLGWSLESVPLILVEVRWHQRHSTLMPPDRGVRRTASGAAHMLPCIVDTPRRIHGNVRALRHAGHIPRRKNGTPEHTLVEVPGLCSPRTRRAVISRSLSPGRRRRSRDSSGYRT